MGFGFEEVHAEQGGKPVAALVKGVCAFQAYATHGDFFVQAAVAFRPFVRQVA